MQQIKLKTYRLIGDIHGMFGNYIKLTKDVENSIQVGDFGLGFGQIEPVLSHGNHKFIRGNHDNPASCKEHVNWIPDGTLHDGTFFCVGGASSIDKSMRTEGVDWWRDEELSYSDFYKIIDDYERLKPEIVISHDIPESVCQKMFHGLYKNYEKSVTRTALDAMYAIHQPKMHFFGHWHMNYNYTDYDTGTVFRCIDKLDYYDLTLQVIDNTPQEQENNERNS